MVSRNACMMSWDGSHQLMERPHWPMGRLPITSWKAPNGRANKPAKGGLCSSDVLAWGYGVYTSSW